MDDLIIDYFEGGYHNHHADYVPDDDLHRDLNNALLDPHYHYHDGPFAALANAAGFDSEPDYDIDDLDGIDALFDDEHGYPVHDHFGEIDSDLQSQRSESSISDGISDSIHQTDQSSHDDDSLHDYSEGEDVVEHYGIPSQGNQPPYDEGSVESDYGSLLSSDEEHHFHRFSDIEEDSDDSQDEEPQALPDNVVNELARVGAELNHLEIINEIRQELRDRELADLIDEEEVDDFPEDDPWGDHFHGLDFEGSFGDGESERQYDSDDSLRTHSEDDDSHLDSDDERSASGGSDDSHFRSSSVSPRSPRDGPFIPGSPPPAAAFFAHPPPGFHDAFHEAIENRRRQSQRLNRDLLHLRNAHFPIPQPNRQPLRRANALAGIDYFLDRLPAPQRDAHGLIAQMEMEMERGRQQRRRAAPSPFHPAPPRLQRQQPQQPPAVIDLTGDDSDNEEVLALPDAPRFQGDANPFAPRQQNRSNPRRNYPHPRRAPSFARSDGSFLGGGAGAAAPIIDLTVDAPEPDSPPPRAFAAPRRRHVQPDNNHERMDGQSPNNWPGPNMNAILRQIGAGIPRNFGVDLLHNMRIAFGGGGGGAGHQGDYEVEFIGENAVRQPGGGPDIPGFAVLDNPLANNPVEFNYAINGINHEPPPRPKPAHIAPPAAREGFTRDTGEETVVICPNCENELEYNPDEKEGHPPPAKRAKTTRKDREEHHFWAVKACGHVYCRKCYENRRPKKNNDSHFELVDKKLLCAVDECTADVTNKTSWVGIFL